RRGETRCHNAQHYGRWVRGDDDWRVSRRCCALGNPWRSNDRAWFRFERGRQVNDRVSRGSRLSPLRLCGVGFGCKKGDVLRVEDIGTQRLDDKGLVTAGDELSTGVSRVSEAKIPGCLG